MPICGGMKSRNTQLPTKWKSEMWDSSCLTPITSGFLLTPKIKLLVSQLQLRGGGIGKNYQQSSLGWENDKTLPHSQILGPKSYILRVSVNER